MNPPGGKAINGKNTYSILTTSTLAKWMVKVGSTSQRDVTQKEKKH